MVNVENKLGIMKLAKTDAFRYIGFQPPLDKETLERLFTPSPIDTANPGLCAVSLETHDDGTMDVGYEQIAFGYTNTDERFRLFAEELAIGLGRYALDVTVRNIGPGSVVAQANSARPDW